MNNISFIDSLRLSTSGLQIKDSTGRFVPLIFGQGKWDGACAVYSSLLNLCMVGYLPAGLVYGDEKLDRRTIDGKIITHFLENKGLVRDGYHFSSLAKELREVCPNLEITVHHTNLLSWIKDSVLDNRPVLLSLTWSTGGGHALLVVGMEYSEEKDEISRIFCIDPAYPQPTYSYYNAFIDLKAHKSPYPFTHCTDSIGAQRIDLQDCITIMPV